MIMCKQRERQMSKRATALIGAVVFSAMATNVHAWDHPGHMTTAAIAFADRLVRPEAVQPDATSPVAPAAVREN